MRHATCWPREALPKLLKPFTPMPMQPTELVQLVRLVPQCRGASCGRWHLWRHCWWMDVDGESSNHKLSQTVVILLWLSCGFPWFPVVLRTFIPSSCPAARLPSAFPTVIIVIYRQISFSLMPIILRHCVRATIHQPCPVFFSGQTRGCCILCGVYCGALAYVMIFQAAVSKDIAAWLRRSDVYQSCVESRNLSAPIISSP